MKTFEDLKQYMNQPTYNIECWNKRREEAKKKFPKELIYELDASGFVKEVVKHRKYKRHIPNEC